MENKTNVGSRKLAMNSFRLQELVDLAFLVIATMSNASLII